MENKVKYYTVSPRMLELYDKGGFSHSFRAERAEEIAAWRMETRRRLKEITGLSMMESCPLEPQTLESVDMGSYFRDKVIIQTEPDVWMPFYLLRPKSIPERKKLPAMIVPHGHGGGKDVTVMNMDNPGVQALVKRFSDGGGRIAFAPALAEEGYLVLCPDARGSGERREWPDWGDEASKHMGNSHRAINQMAVGFGMSLAGMMIWDLMRLIDYVQSLPLCDGERIGCGGMSGGGMQTLWLSAMDDRVALAITGGYFYGMKESLVGLPHNCSCNYVPYMWNTMDMGDMAALIAPRPLLIETGDQDHLNGKSLLDNVYPQVEIARRAYRLLDAEERLEHYVFQGGHEWRTEPALAFVKKWLPVRS
ncbi:MAG: alpha/beta hydrolase family protein [Clostridia bacterium]|jgi:dienelactone hydrolase